MNARMRLMLAAALLAGLAACSRHPPPPDTPLVLEDSAVAPYPPELLDCAKDDYAFATSLGDLPGQLQYPGGHPAWLADPDQPTTRREGRDLFEGAAVGRDHLFVAITSPWGVVSFTNTWVFERRGSRWLGRVMAGGSGRSLEAVLGHACRQFAPKSSWTSRAVNLDSCTLNQRAGLVTLAYEAAGRRASFEMRPQDTRSWEFRRESITVSGRSQPPSSAELEALRTALFATRPDMREDDDCAYQVRVFLLALG